MLPPESLLPFLNGQDWVGCQFSGLHTFTLYPTLDLRIHHVPSQLNSGAAWMVHGPFLSVSLHLQKMGISGGWAAVIAPKKGSNPGVREGQHT